MPFLSGIAKTIGSKNIGKLIGDGLGKDGLSGISKTLQGLQGQGGPLDSILKKAVDGVKKAETQGKDLAKIATDAEKKGEEAIGDAVDGMKKLVDGQAAAIGNIAKMLQSALDEAKSQGEGEGGGGSGGKGAKGKSKGKGGGADVTSALEEALKKVSEISKTAAASKKEMGKAKKNKGKKGGGGN
jgi:hypothetical protein